VVNGDEGSYLASRSEELLWRARFTRREIVRLGAGLPVALGIARLARPGSAGAAGRGTGSPIVKPLPSDWFIDYGSNAEMRWDSLHGVGYEIPNERFFVRDHTATPRIAVSSWRLRVFGSGLKGRGRTFSYDQLRKLPARELVSSVECAGNGRSFFASQEGTPASGTQWRLGGIGVARWRGVALAEVLERSGLGKTALDVMPYGADPAFVSNGIDHGHVRRPLPIAKALDDALLAFEMNGQQLPPDHGFPVRLIVPGWIGAASIKWVAQIAVSKRPLFSFWNTQQYVLQGDAYPRTPVLTTQTVKSAWELAWGAELPANTPIRLRGRAWSGTSPIERVDVSIDHGATWTRAGLHGANSAGAWNEFTYTFPAQPAGSYELWARARDTSGRVQPPTVPFNSGGYLFGAVVRHPVVLR